MITRYHRYEKIELKNEKVISLNTLLALGENIVLSEDKSYLLWRKNKSNVLTIGENIGDVKYKISCVIEINNPFEAAYDLVLHELQSRESKKLIIPLSNEWITQASRQICEFVGYSEALIFSAKDRDISDIIGYQRNELFSAWGRYTEYTANKQGVDIVCWKFAKEARIVQIKAPKDFLYTNLTFFLEKMTLLLHKTTTKRLYRMMYDTKGKIVLKPEKVR